MTRSLSKLTDKYFIKTCACLLIFFYFVNGIQYLQSQSITSDEPYFFDYAKRYATGYPERIHPATDNSKMPVSVLNLVPRAVEQLVHPGLKKTDWGASDIIMGRYITLLTSIFTLLLVFKWSSELYGSKAGLFALFLMSFCPNNLANAGLVTTDSYSVLFLLATIYFLWKFCRFKSNRYFLLFCFTIAASQLVKQSLFHLYIIAPVCICIYHIVNNTRFNGRLLFIYVTGFILINWFVINLGYYFYGTNTLLGNYQFMSNLFKTVQQTFPSSLRLPLPSPFVTGLDMVKYYDQLSGGFDKLSSFGKVTILEKSATGGSFWYYYFVSIFFKTPVSYIIFLIYAIIIMVKQRSLNTWFGNEFFLIMPVVYFIFTMSFFLRLHSGIRHIIFIYPFLFILSSGIIPGINNNFKKIAVTGLCFFLVFSVSRYWKNYYPYTNEFIYDKKMAYSYVGAGNLEFNQGKYFRDAYLSKHPEVRMAPTNPEQGTFLINTADYLDIWNRHRYDWITRFRPSGQVAYNWLIITVDAKDLPKK